MEEKKILQSITDTLTGKKIHQLTIRVRSPKPRFRQDVEAVPVSCWRRLLGQKPKEIVRDIEIALTDEDLVRRLDIWPCIVSNQYRIAGNAAMLIDGLYEDHSRNIQFIIQNQPLVVYTVAAAIQNNDQEPDPELIDFISNNFDGEDLYTALLASFDNLGMQAFSNSIVLLKGTVTILSPDQQTSPKDGSELIASHIQELAQRANTSGGPSTT